MPAQSGNDFLLKIQDDATPTQFNLVGGFRSNSFTVNGESVETTSKDSQGFRALLSGAGIRSLSASGAGVFEDDASFASINTKVLAGTIVDWQIVVPDFGTYEGAFHIASLEMGGEYNGEVTYSISLESAGVISWTAA